MVWLDHLVRQAGGLHEIEPDDSVVAMMFRTCFEVLVAIIGLVILRPGTKAPQYAPNQKRQPDGNPNPLYDPGHQKPNPSPPPPPKKGSVWP